MRYQITRISNRGKVMVSVLPSVLDDEVPDDAIRLLQATLREADLLDTNRRLPDAARDIRRHGRRQNGRFGIVFKSCSPVRVDNKPRRRQLEIPQGVGMLWFYMAYGRRAVQFVGTLGMCRKRIQRGI